MNDAINVSRKSNVQHRRGRKADTVHPEVVTGIDKRRDHLRILTYSTQSKDAILYAIGPGDTNCLL